MEDNCQHIKKGMAHCFVFGYESCTLKIIILQMSQVPQDWLDFWYDLGNKK